MLGLLKICIIGGLVTSSVLCVSSAVVSNNPVLNQSAIKKADFVPFEPVVSLLFLEPGHGKALISIDSYDIIVGFDYQYSAALSNQFGYKYAEIDSIYDVVVLDKNGNRAEDFTDRKDMQLISELIRKKLVEN